MSKAITTTVATITDATTAGEATAVDTIGTRQHTGGDARFFLSVSSITGTVPTMDVDIVTTIAGVDHVLGSFAQVTETASTQTQSITVTLCPNTVKVEYTDGGTVTDFDAVVTCVRF